MENHTISKLTTRKNIKPGSHRKQYTVNDILQDFSNRYSPKLPIISKK